MTARTLGAEVLDMSVRRSTKPRLRGVFHAIGALVAGPFVFFCVASASTREGTLAASIYGASVLFLLIASAVYHVPHWEPKARMWLRRLDHTAIFFLIAGTYTPFCLLSLPEAGTKLLVIMWTIAGLGALQSMAWPKAPRWVTVPLYLVMGWMVIPYLGEFRSALDAKAMALMAVGGVLYSLGALCYARRWPNPRPATFGYHEIFHLLVVAALACHFLVVWNLVTA